MQLWQSINEKRMQLWQWMRKRWRRVRWRKIRWAEIPDADKDLFEQFGESVIGLTVASGFNP